SATIRSLLHPDTRASCRAPSNSTFAITVIRLILAAELDISRPSATKAEHSLSLSARSADVVASEEKSMRLDLFGFSFQRSIESISLTAADGDEVAGVAATGMGALSRCAVRIDQQRWATILHLYCD